MDTVVASVSMTLRLRVNPTNANELYLGGSAGNTACGNGMKKSIDGGATFFRDQNGLHADSHALFFDGAGKHLHRK